MLCWTAGDTVHSHPGVDKRCSLSEPYNTFLVEAIYSIYFRMAVRFSAHGLEHSGDQELLGCPHSCAEAPELAEADANCKMFKAHWHDTLP